MSNPSTSIEKRPVIFNHTSGYIVTTYSLIHSEFGDEAWIISSVDFEKSAGILNHETQYQIKGKATAFVQNKSATRFEVFELIGGQWVFIGSSYVYSRGLARDKTCLKAWLNREY